MLPQRAVKAVSLFALLQLVEVASAKAWSQKGCYSSSGDLTDVTTPESSMYADYDTCGATCTALGSTVGAMWNGGSCYCGNLLPPTDDVVDSSQCSTECHGFGQQNCGGPNAYNIFLTGINPNPDAQVASSSASQQQSSPATSAATSAATSVATSAASATSSTPKETAVKTDVVATSTQQKVVTHDNTIVQTVAASGPTPTQDSDDAAESTAPPSGSSTGTKVGIAVGVIVGVVVLASIIAGTFVYLRHRKVKEEEKRHRRNESLRSFTGDKPRYAPSDSRLDPGMMVERRSSNGSVFADNADYSRKILKVANPDES